MTSVLCPKKPYWVVKDSDRTVRFPACCDSYRCLICVQAKVRQRVKLAAWGASKMDWLRFVTLTLAPPKWQQLRSQVRDFFRRARRTYVLEAAWTVERNPKGTGYHVHALTYGEHMPKERLEQMWGGRFVDIQAASLLASDYMAKLYRMAGYSTKLIAETLEMNGGRCLHMTRGYLHGRTAREALQEMSKGEEWHLESATMEERADIVALVDGLPACDEYGEILE